MKTNVLWAIFKRNFFAYFASPTGYVFICVFVLLSSFAAFWPDEFFNANLANLDQLNRVLPWIMLIFIPSISMGIWAEERRQGTDELVLTIPAGDFEIVLGKYLAAVAIFSVALLFSLVSNYVVLRMLGNPDLGLFLGTYVGYWLVGLAMLAVGMVASFLTSNLTIAFILGAVLNAPLAFASFAEVIFGESLAVAVKRWSIAYRFRDFGRGVVDLSSMAYFLGIVAVMLYLSMVLIGRRHWARGLTGRLMGLHYAARTLAVAVAAVAAVLLFGQFGWLRLDVTSERINSLSDRTAELLADMKTEQPIVIDAYLTPEDDLPEDYVETRLNLVAMLQEFQALAGSKLQVQVHDTKGLSEQAAAAKDRFGITSREVPVHRRGIVEDEELFMGVAFTCGLNRVVIPFIHRGGGVEYELIRSVVTVQKPQRKKIGFLKTEMVREPMPPPGMNPMMMQAQNLPLTDPVWAVPWIAGPLMGEVEKEFDVVEIDPNKKIPVTREDEAEMKKKKEEKKKRKEPKLPWEQDEEEGEDNERCDVLVAVQPSMLTEKAMDNFVAALKSGLPTVIFEDPLPVAPLLYQQSILWPTSEGRRLRTQAPNQQLMMQMYIQSMKADASKLWETLGLDADRDLEFDPKRVIWQDYAPTARLERLPKEYVFIDQECGAEKPLSEEDSITAGLRRLFFVFPGGIALPDEVPQGFSPLVTTGRRGGTMTYDWRDYSSMKYVFGEWDRDRKKQAYVLAAYIQSPKKKPKAADAKEKKTENGDKEKNDPDKAKDESAGGGNEKVHAVVVFDIDSLVWFWPLLGGEEFDNLSFDLNALDVMSADVTLLDIRNRRPKHRTLTGIQAVIDGARKEADESIDQVEERFKESAEGTEGEKAGGGDDAESAAEGLVASREEAVSKRYAEEAKRRELRAIQTDLAAQIQQIQSRYKIWAVVVPPIPPLLIALVVFVIRRFREYEGVATSRRR